MNTQGIVSTAAKMLLAGAVLLAVYAGAGFYIVPMVLKSKLPEIIQQETGRKAAIAKLELDPFSLRLKLQGFEMQELDGSPFVSFDTFYLSIDAQQSIRQRALVLDRVLLSKPFVHIARQKNGAFNFTDLSKPKDPAEQEDGGMLPLSIGKLSIAEGKLAWDDAQNEPPVSEAITPFNFEFENFATLTDKTFPLALSLALQSGGDLHWQGTGGIKPLISEGHIKLDKINLENIQRLALRTVPFDLKGKQTLEADYKLSYAGNKLVLEIKQSKLAIADFQFLAKQARQESVNVSAFTLDGQYELSYADNNLKLGIQQSKLAIRDFQFSTKEAGKVGVKIPNLTLDAEYKVSSADDNLVLEIQQSKLAMLDFQFSAQEPGKVSVNVPALSLDGGFTVSYADEHLNVAGTQGKLDIKGFQLSEFGQEKALIKIPAASGRGLGFNLNERSLTLDSVAAKDAELQAWLNADGRINYQSLFAAETGANAVNQAKEVPGAAQSSPWSISVGNVALTNFGLEFEDRTLKKPVLMTLAPIDLKLTGFSNQAGARLPVELSAGVNKTGTLKLTGDAVLAPLSAQMAVSVKELDLEKFQPYVNQFVRLDVIDGQLAVEGKVTVAQPKPAQLDVKFKGNTEVASFLTRDQLQNKDFVKWEQLSLKDIDVDVRANRYSASALVIRQPYARVMIKQDKTSNFSDILYADKSNLAAAKSKPPEPSEQKKIDFKLGRVQVIDGSSDFADLSLILPFSAHIKSLDGGASGISSAPESTVNVLLKGNAYDLSPVVVKGDIRPYLGDYNIMVSFKGLPMPLVSPYMVQFAGYKVEKGKLSLDLIYNVEKGSLSAENYILIDQFELGEKVENPNAVSLPLKLAVALLKDGDGKIKIDVPITGSLEDPKFSVGALITDALMNAISKVVTSPFHAIGALIGSSEDLSRVNFPAGKSGLDETEKTKLNHLSKALNERPELTLEIKGAAFEEQDWPALTEDALHDQLKRIKAAEINKKGGKKIRSEYVELTDEDYKRLLAQLFIEKFPLMADRSIFGKPRLTDPNAGDFYEVARQKLESIIKPEEKRLKELAAERAQTIARYIVQQGGVSNDRVYILDVAIDPEREGKDITAALSLKVK